MSRSGPRSRCLGAHLRKAPARGLQPQSRDAKAPPGNPMRPRNADVDAFWSNWECEYARSGALTCDSASECIWEYHRKVNPVVRGALELAGAFRFRLSWLKRMGAGLHCRLEVLVVLGQVKSRFTLLGGKKAMCRGGGSRAQGLVRAGVVPTTPRSLERVRREMSHLLVVLCRPGNFCSFSL